MHNNFDQSLAWVLKSEGGWSDQPDDPPTMRGVTLATFRRYVKPGATKEDLRRITASQIRTIYKRHFWDPVMGDDLPSGVDYCVFDYAVNSGIGHAAQELQRVLGVPIDGRIGPKTLEAARRRLPKTTVVLLQQYRLRYLRSLTKWGKYGGGWAKRVARVQEQAIDMIENDKPAVAERMPTSRWSFFKAFVKGDFS